MAVLVVMGLYSLRLAYDTPARDEWLLVHKSLGVLGLLLVLFQICWIRYSPPQLDNSRFQPWERLASKIGHLLLYAILVLMPLSGMMMSQGSGREVGFFNIVNLPQILPLDPNVGGREQYYYKLGKYLHDVPFQWALYVIVGLHLAGTFKHRVIDGDKGFLRRMWGMKG